MALRKKKQPRRVFVTQEPVKFDPYLQAVVPSVDMDTFSNVAEYGKIVFVIEGLTPPWSEMNKIVNRMHDVLQDFTSNDILLGIGHPIIMQMAAVIAAQYSQGHLNMLYFMRGPRQYERIDATLFETEQETTNG